MKGSAEPTPETSHHEGDGGAPGRCVRCGAPAARYCFLFSARSGGGAVPGGMFEDESGVPIDDGDLEAESFFVCERCVDQNIGRRRYVGIGAGGVLLFLGLLLLVTAYGEAQTLGLALTVAGLVWGGWALLDTYDARDASTARIAKEEAQSRTSRRYRTRDEVEAAYGRPPVAGRLPHRSDGS